MSEEIQKTELPSTEAEATVGNQTATPEEPRVEFNKSNVYLMWGLFAGSLLIPFICTIAALVVAYLKRPDSTTREELSHFDAGIKTFWICFILFIVSIPLYAVAVGPFVMIGSAIFYIYRVIRGFIRVGDGREY